MRPKTECELEISFANFHSSDSNTLTSRGSRSVAMCGQPSLVAQEPSPWLLKPMAQALRVRHGTTHRSNCEVAARWRPRMPWMGRATTVCSELTA